jgi:tetratricopeptide (TPR) repeat protein
MRVSTVLSAAAAFLLVGCAQQGANGAREGQGQFAGYNAYQPLPSDPPNVIQELAAAKADVAAAQAAMRMGDRARAMQIAQRAMAELQEARNRRAQLASGNYAEQLNALRKIESGEAPEMPGVDREVAREQIGEFYENGQDYAAARRWYQKAIDTPGADFAITKAKVKLANLYEMGLGGPRDHAKAEQLINSTGVLTQDAQAAKDKREREQAEMWLRAFMTPGPGISRYHQQENTEVGSGIAGGSWLNSAERSKEQQMEDINQQRSEPLTRDDSLYKEMNNPSNPQE